MTQHIFCLGPYMGGPYLLRQGRTFSGLLLGAFFGRKNLKTQKRTLSGECPSCAWPRGWRSNCVPEPLPLPVGHARRLSQAVASAETLRLASDPWQALSAPDCAIPG